MIQPAVAKPLPRMFANRQMTPANHRKTAYIGNQCDMVSVLCGSHMLFIYGKLIGKVR
jgi:hypothetical protein